MGRKPMTVAQKAHKAEYDKKRYVERREQVLAYQAQYYAENRERVIERCNAYYHANAPEVLAKQSERRFQLIADDPTYRERENAAGQARVAARPDHYREVAKRGSMAWRLRNPGRNAERLRLKYWANPEKARLRGLLDAQNRRARLLAASGEITAADLSVLRLRQKGKCAFCLKPFGKETPHLDHYVSLARGGTNEMSNLRLLHRLCNMRKHAKHPLDFGLENGLLVW